MNARLQLLWSVIIFFHFLCSVVSRKHKECKTTVAGMNYRGTISITRSGYTCRRWDTQQELKVEDYPDAGLTDNYCRNPNNETEGPWCFIFQGNEEKHPRREYCDIPMCNEAEVVTEMELTSKGCFDKCSKRDCKYGPGSIHINAVTYTSNSTGLFVAVLHQKTGSVIQTKHLTRSSQVEFSNYSSFFESIPVGSVVAVATRSVCKYDGWYALIARYLVLQDSAEGKEPSKPDAAVLVTCRYQCPADIKGDNFPYQDIAGSSHGPRSVKLRLTFPGNSSGVERGTTLPPYTQGHTNIIPSTQINPTEINVDTNGKHSPKGQDNELFKIGDWTLDRKWFITGVALGSVILSATLFAFIFMCIRKRHRSGSNGRLVRTQVQNRDRNELLQSSGSYSKTTSLYANISDNGYVKVPQNSTYEKVSPSSSVNGSPCNTVLRAEGSPPQVRVYVEPASTCVSTSPSKSFNLFAERRSECYPETGESPPQFAEYIFVSKDGPVYKKPSNVPKHEPPKERPPTKEESERDSYVCMQPHEYDAPTSPYETAVFVPDESNQMYETTGWHSNDRNDLYETAVFVPPDPDEPDYVNGSMARPVR